MVSNVQLVGCKKEEARCRGQGQEVDTADAATKRYNPRNNTNQLKKQQTNAGESGLRAKKRAWNADSGFKFQVFSTSKTQPKRIEVSCQHPGCGAFFTR